MRHPKTYRLIFYSAVAFLVTQCVEPYAPPEIKGNSNFLVVDGFLNATDGTVNVKLSRSIPLADPGVSPAETNASITLEDSEGDNQELAEQGQGTYALSGVTIDFTRKYRLNIVTASNEQYVSEFVEVRITPPIDTLGWEPTDQGVKVYISAHDNTNSTRYYQWDYTETYEYNAVYFSPYTYKDGVVTARGAGEYFYTCWKDVPSPHILITSTRQLAEDIVNEFPVTLIPKGSQKLFQRYSILVKQRDITEEAYEFYEQLKNTTEELGGLFDPQPGQVTGNISSVDHPNEVVLGFFNASTVHEKRFFIKRSDLPTHLAIQQTEGDCFLQYIDVGAVGAFPAATHDLVEGVYVNLTLVGYHYSLKACTDCRLQGGTIEQPDFW